MQNKLRLTSLSLAVIATSLLLGSTSALAANYKGDYKGEEAVVMPVCNELHDGFYVGLQVGYDSYSVDVDPAAVVGAPLGLTVGGSTDMAANGWVGGLFVGYGMYFNNLYYLGVEVFGNGSGASRRNTFSGFDTATGLGATLSNRFSVGGSYGISLLPGVKLNNASLLYVRLGYNQASFRGTTTITDTATGASLSDSRSNWEGGFNYGIGMETLLWPQWSLRGEFTHTNYGSFRTPSFGTKFEPSDNQYMVSLIYHFA